MHPLRIGIDLDGVVADFNHGWTWRYNRDFPGRLAAPLTSEDVVMWDAPTLLTHFTTMHDFWVWAETCAEGRSLFHGLDPYPGAIESMEDIGALGHHLVILTTKPDFSVHDTYDWLGRWRIPSTEIHILDDKTTVACDLYLDDADHNIDALVRAHPNATVCRYVRPWNNQFAGSVDVGDWIEFAEVVRQHGIG